MFYWETFILYLNAVRTIRRFIATSVLYVFSYTCHLRATLVVLHVLSVESLRNFLVLVCAVPMFWSSAVCFPVSLCRSWILTSSILKLKVNNLFFVNYFIVVCLIVSCFSVNYWYIHIYCMITCL